MAGAYALAIVCMCFLPQSWYPQYKDFETPGIVQIGRIYLLPTPFNSIVNGDQVDSLYELWLIILQNLTNIFLLYPLVLAFLFLSEKWRSLRAVMRYSFGLSLLSSAPSSSWTSSSMLSGSLKWTTSGPIPWAEFWLMGLIC